MHGTRNSSILSLIFIAALASPLCAQDRMRVGDTGPTQDMTPAQRTFANAYVSAVTGPDIERYKRLLHPRTRACMNRDNADFFNNIFGRRGGRTARNPQVSLEKLPKNFGMFSAARSNGLTYPARPTHAFHINLVGTGPRQSAVIAFAVRENGIWYEVLPCPSAKSLELMREAQRRDAAESITARALADSLQDPLRGELLALVKDSGSISAAKRYSEAAQVELTMARRVVKVLEKEER